MFGHSSTTRVNLSDAELDAIDANGGVVEKAPYRSTPYLAKLPADFFWKIAAIRKLHGLSGDFARAVC